MSLVVVGYALGPLIISRRLGELPSLDVVAVSLGACALLYAPVGIAQLPATMPSPAVLASVAVLGIVCTAVAFLLFFRLIAEVGPVRATVIAYVNPAIAVLAGVALLAEPFTLGTALGLVFILAGSWLATGPTRAVTPGADARDDRLLERVPAANEGEMRETRSRVG